MSAGKMAFGAVLIAGLGVPAEGVQACGRWAMAMPAVGYAVAAPADVPPIGFAVTVLPPGCVRVMVNGALFFRAGPAWYQPFRGPMGSRYHVVPAPHGT